MSRTSKIILTAIIAIMLLGAVSAVKDKPVLVGSDVHCVTTGDTLWSIALLYCPNDMDVRDYIDFIQEDNYIENSLIRNGDVIEVRRYEEK